MEVTKDNFVSTWPLMEQSIRNAEFVAIDTELTGLHDAGEEERYHDTLNERFERMKTSASKFLVCQFGLCTFERSCSEDGAVTYVARPFNFYIFPTQVVSSTTSAALDAKLPDVHFLCNSSSMDFLASHDFDFNKWIKKGLPFVTKRDIQNVKNAQQEMKERPGIDPKDASSLEFIKTTSDLIHQWLQKSSEPRLVLPSPSAYHRRLIYEHVRSGYNGFVHAEKIDNKMTVVRLTAEEKKKREQAQASTEAVLPLNFCRVIDLLLHLQKPLVGHNCFFDLVHMFYRFVGGMADASSWRHQIHTSLPTIIDTKVLATSAPGVNGHLPTTGLESVTNAVRSSPFLEYGPVVEFAKDFGGYEAMTSAHEAGYDAYITGLVYLRLSYKVLRDHKVETSPAALFTSEILRPYYNVLHMLRSDLAYFPLDGRKIPMVQDEPTKFIILLDDDVQYSVPQLIQLFTLPGVKGEDGRPIIPRRWKVLYHQIISVDIEDEALQEYVFAKARDLPGFKIKRWLSWWNQRMGDQFDGEWETDEEHDLDAMEEDEYLDGDSEEADWDENKLEDDTSATNHVEQGPDKKRQKLNVS